MFCFNCGKQLPDGARFCPDCGAKQAKPPTQQAEKNRKIWRIALIVILSAAVVAAAVFGIVKLIGGGSPSRGVSVSEEEEEEEEDPATLEQVLLAQSVHMAQLTGQCAGSDAFLSVSGTPEVIYNYAQSFSIFAGQPKRVLWCGASALLEVAEAVGGEVPEQMTQQQMIGSMATLLNGRYIGNEMLAAASVIAGSEMAKLPEALDETMVFVVEYDVPEGFGPKAFVTVTPSNGKFAGFSCTPLGPDVFEIAGLDKLDCWKTADRDTIEEAVKAAEDVSLRAMAAPNVTADAAWYSQQANVVLARFAALDLAEVPSMISQYTTDAVVVELATEYVRAAGAGAVSCAMYPVDPETLLAELDADESAELEADGLAELLARRMTAAYSNMLSNRYGVESLAAGTVAARLALLSDAPSDAVPLPEAFVPQIAVFELAGERCMFVTLFDAGNNILGTAIGFAPTCEAAEELAETLA